MITISAGCRADNGAPGPGRGGLFSVWLVRVRRSARSISGNVGGHSRREVLCSWGICAWWDSFDLGIVSFHGPIVSTLDLFTS